MQVRFLSVGTTQFLSTYTHYLPLKTKYVVAVSSGFGGATMH
jgi:hypothetical protein